MAQYFARKIKAFAGINNKAATQQFFRKVGMLTAAALFSLNINAQIVKNPNPLSEGISNDSSKAYPTAQYSPDIANFANSGVKDVEMIGKKCPDVTLDGKVLVVGERTIDFGKEFSKFGKIRQIIDTNVASLGDCVYAVCDYGFVLVPKDSAIGIAATVPTKHPIRINLFNPTVTPTGDIFGSTEKEFIGIIVEDSIPYRLKVPYKDCGPAFRKGIKEAMFSNDTELETYDGHIYINVMDDSEKGSIEIDTKAKTISILSLENGGVNVLEIKFGN